MSEGIWMIVGASHTKAVPEADVLLGDLDVINKKAKQVHNGELFPHLSLLQKFFAGNARAISNRNYCNAEGDFHLRKSDVATLKTMEILNKKGVLA